MKDEIKEIYLSNLEWFKTQDDIGVVNGNITFKNSISLKEFEKILENTYVILCDKDYINNLQEENERLKNDKKKILELIENDYFEDGSFENYYKVLNILTGGDEE